MNEVIQYWDFDTMLTGTSTAQGLQTFRVPDEFCFRVRAVEFRVDVLLFAADSRFTLGLSKRFEDRPRLPDTVFLTYQKFLAYWAMESELTGTAGASAFPMSKRVELWDYDYRLVLRPTLLTRSNGATFTIAFGVHGELVPCTEGQRNAIIAWQGGLAE